MSDQYVYFIQADESGPIKIGFTADNPKRRLSQLQTGNASALRLLGAIKGTSAQERQFHADLAEWRLQGEWFEPHPTVLETVQKALSAPVPDRGGPLHCSFCLRASGEVKLLFQGAAGNICSDCVRDGIEQVDEAEARCLASEHAAVEMRGVEHGHS